MKTLSLQALIYTKYANMCDFSHEIGWSTAKISRIVNHKQEPTAEEICKMADCLQISTPEELEILLD